MIFLKANFRRIRNFKQPIFLFSATDFLFVMKLKPSGNFYSLIWASSLYKV